MPWIAHEPSNLESRLALIDQWRNGWELGGDSTLGVFRDDVVVGGAGLHRRVGPNAVEIGYWIHVDHLRNGYATQAAEALMIAAFEVAGIDRVEIHHDKANIASAGVPRRLGFTLVGETPAGVTAPGEIGVDCQWIMVRPV